MRRGTCSRISCSRRLALDERQTVTECAGRNSHKDSELRATHRRTNLCILKFITPGAAHRNETATLNRLPKRACRDRLLWHSSFPCMRHVLCALRVGRRVLFVPAGMIMQCGA